MPPTSSRKFLGNLADVSTLNFTRYWNQVTPENSGKWASVEPTRDRYNFAPLDRAYRLARDNGFPFKLHTFIWGSQEPAFLAGLSNAERAEEAEEFIRDTCARYPDAELIDVVNEPLHAPSNARRGLGGDGATGFDWVIRSFQLARRHCPGAKLLLNEFGVINDRDFAARYRRIVELLRDRGLIDGVGLQSHSFNVVGFSPATLRGNLDFIAAAGVPIYISEFDIDAADDQVQLREYQEKFPIVWQHPAVVGVTVWGYLFGRTFLPNSGLMFADGRERPALTWLTDYVRRTAPRPSQSPIIIRASGTSGGEHINLIIAGSVVADFTLSTSPQGYVYVGPASGDILVQFDNDAPGRDVILDFVLVNNEIRQAEDQSFNTTTFNGTCGAGSFSELMHCNGSIGFGNTDACFSGRCTSLDPQR